MENFTSMQGKFLDLRRNVLKNICFHRFIFEIPYKNRFN